MCTPDEKREARDEFQSLTTDQMAQIFQKRRQDEEMDAREDGFKLTYRGDEFNFYVGDPTVEQVEQAHAMMRDSDRVAVFVERLEKNGEEIEVGKLPFALSGPTYRRCVRFFDQLGRRHTS